MPKKVWLSTFRTWSGINPFLLKPATVTCLIRRNYSIIQPWNRKSTASGSISRVSANLSVTPLIRFSIRTTRAGLKIISGNIPRIWKNAWSVLPRNYASKRDWKSIFLPYPIWMKSWRFISLPSPKMNSGKSRPFIFPKTNSTIISGICNGNPVSKKSISKPAGFTKITKADKLKSKRY